MTKREPRQSPAALVKRWPDTPAANPAAETARRFVLNLRDDLGDRSVRADKDAVDLSNLFAVLDAHGADALGGWRLKEAELKASRRDAALHLHRLADAWEAKPPKARVDARALVSRIRTHVTRP